MPKICKCGHKKSDHADRCFAFACDCFEFEYTNQPLIVVLADGETWTELVGCKVMMITVEQLNQLNNGVKPRDLLAPQWNVSI